MTAERGTRFPSPAERRRRNREEMTEAILDAARQIMREQGAAALNLNEVARRVGVKTPSLYEYFSGKMALYDALFRLGVRLYAERMSRLNESTDSFWARSRAGLENYMTFAQEYPELYQLVFERPVPGFVPSEESMTESRGLLTMSDEIVEKGIERGSIALGITIPQARDLFIAMMHGLTALHMANEPELPAGSGRFGSLIPAAVALFRAAWEPRPSQVQDEQPEKD